MKKQVLVAPGVDKPEALARESLDGAFCHLSDSSKSVLQHCVQAAPLQTRYAIRWIGYYQLVPTSNPVRRVGSYA